MEFSSGIVITDTIEEESITIKESLYPSRVVSFIKDDFLVDDAKEVIREAYIAEDKVKTIILAAKIFNEASQNALLKILEEPPRNIEFIIITESKAAILPTVRSRLPLVNRQGPHRVMDIELSLAKLDLQSMFTFIKEHEKTPKHEAKELIEAIYDRAMKEGMMLNASQLESFENAYKLIHLNARLNSVLSMLLLKFIRR